MQHSNTKPKLTETSIFEGNLLRLGMTLSHEGPQYASFFALSRKTIVLENIASLTFFQLTVKQLHPLLHFNMLQVPVVTYDRSIKYDQ